MALIDCTDHDGLLTVFLKGHIDSSNAGDLEQEIEDEKQRAASIEEYREYTRTDQFIEQIAREKLGLLYEGETIFREEDGR